MTAEYKSIKLEKKEGVAEVALIGPGKGNAMGPDFWRETPEVFAALDRDEETRAIVVRGEGNNFSYGLDLAAMMGDLGQQFGGGKNLAAERTRFLDLVGEMQRSRSGSGIDRCGGRSTRQKRNGLC